MTRTTRLSSDRSPGGNDANPGILPNVAYFAYGEYIAYMSFYAYTAYMSYYAYIAHRTYYAYIAYMTYYAYMTFSVDSTTRVSAVSQLPDAEDSGTRSGSAKKLRRKTN